MENDYDLIFCVFACDKFEKYCQEIRLINETWGKQCIDRVKLLFFLGEEKTDEFVGDCYINLKDVKDDYFSASHKQFLGLKYIYDNYKFKYVHCCGTDTFINVPKLLKLLNEFNFNEPLYIGGHGCVRKIYGKDYYFHSGGPGFSISKSCIHILYPILDKIVHLWNQICIDENNGLSCACDVAISYYLQQPNTTTIIKKCDNFFYCNYLGHLGNFRCCAEKVVIKDIISCHNMSNINFIDFYNILLQNNFFVY